MLAERRYDIEIEWVAQRVRQHDCLGSRRDSSFYFARINVVGAEVDVDKYGYCTELQDGVHSCREAGGDADHFISGANGALAEAGRG